MQYNTIKGLEKKISKLIIGNDNQTEYDHAAKLWDHWISIGGNAFDNAFIYGDGSMERLLGKWLKNRNNREELIIIAKGAHNPFCDPKNISNQLEKNRYLSDSEIYSAIHNLVLPKPDCIEVLEGL